MSVELELLQQAEGYFGVPLQPAAHDTLVDKELRPDDIRIIAAAGLAIAQEMGISDTGAFSITRTHLQMLYNLDTYIESREDGMSQSELREHQHDVFHKIHDFFAHPPQDDDGEFLRHGYIKLPTGTGKTAIFTTLVDVLNRPVGNESAKLKSLILVPKLDLVGQTVGDEGADTVRGFARFAMDTTVSEYHGQKKDLSGDAVVMTYSSFRNLVKAGKIPQDLFDIVICDELHNALGPQTSEAIKQYGQDKFVLGLTATEEYSQDKKVIDLLPYEIDSMDLREAIEEGFLAPVRCFAITSDTTIDTLKDSRGDFNEAELSVLIENEWRNQKAVEFAKSFVEEGKQGLISCVPGQNLAHARLMAAEVSKQQVVDAKTGKIRNIRALAVDGKMSKKERENIYQAYERGEYDVLTYVDLLTEGWDSAQAKFLINLRPTTSPVNAVQRLGRILRPNENGDIATVVEFIDKSSKPQFTFYHALGEDTIELGRVYGKLREQTGEHRPHSDIANLPADVRELLRGIDHKLIGELIVTKRESLIPEGYQSIERFSTTAGVSARTIVALIEKHALIPHNLHSGRRMANYLDTDQQALLLDDEFLKCPPITDEEISLSQLVPQLNTSRPQIQKIAEELDIPITPKKISGRPSLTVKKSDIDRIAGHPYFKERAVIAANTPLYKAAEQLGISPKSVKKLAEELGLELGEIKTGNGYTTTILSAEQIAAIRRHPFFEIPMAEEDSLTAPKFAASLGERHGTVLDIAAKHGIKPVTRRVTSGRSVTVFTAEQQLRIKQLPYFSEEKPPQEGEVSLRSVMTELGISMPTAQGILVELGIESHERRGRARGLYMREADKQRMLESAYFQVQPMAENERMIYKLARELNIGTDMFRMACELGGITISSRRTANAQIAEVVSEEDIEAIKTTLEERLPSLPDGFVTVAQFAKKHANNNPARVKKLAKQHDLALGEYRTEAGRLAASLSPEQQSAILALL